MNADNSSTVNALGKNTGAASTTPPLLSLPNELIEAVAMHLNSPADLLSMRSTCRHLRNGSAVPFTKLCFKTTVQISGTGSSIRDMTDMLLSPNLSGAQHLARSLEVKAPGVHLSWPLDVAHLRKSMSPSLEDVQRLLAAMPELKVVFVLDEYPSEHSLEVGAIQSAPILLRGLAAPGSSLPRSRRLVLLNVCIEGSLLVNLFEKHKDSLEDVSLSMVRTSGTTSWVEILTRLHSTNVSSMRLYFLESLDGNGNTIEVLFPTGVYVFGRSAGHEQRVNIGRATVDTVLPKPVLEIILQEWANSSQ